MVTTLKRKQALAANDDNANFYGLDSVLILANGKKLFATVNNAKE